MRQEDPNRQLDKNVDNRPTLIISLDHSPTSSAMLQKTNEASAPPNNSPSLQLTENCVRDVISLLPNQQNTIRNSENEIVNINTNNYQAFLNANPIRTNQVESNNEMPAPLLTINFPYFIGSDETGNMNPTNTSPLSENSYHKTERPYIAQANGLAAATENFSVPAERKRSFDTNRSKYVAPGAVPYQQNILTNNFQNTTLGREHFYNTTDAGRNPENLVEQQGNYATTQPVLNGHYQDNIRITRTTINISPSFEITIARSSPQTFA